MTAPLYPLSEFTPEEAAKVAEFEAAPTPPEVLREQVAAALYLSEPAVCPDLPFTSITEREQEHFYRLADAALAVFRGQQDPPRAFAEWVVSLDDDNPESPGRQERRTVTLTQIVDRARTAIGGDGR